MEHKESLNDLITQFAPEWPVDQLAVIDRNILRLALYEIGSRKQATPPKVIINEAVELTRTFGAEQSHRYVNGVLDALARAVRSDEVRKSARRRG